MKKKPPVSIGVTLLAEHLWKTSALTARVIDHALKGEE